MKSANVPSSIAYLLPLAEVWGIGDDLDREAAVESAATDDLRQMVEAVDYAEDLGLYDWLSGDESYADQPSDEYVAITCLTMAADLARPRLRREA